MQVTFVRKQVETETITTFYFKPEKAVQYTAGQFIELTIPHKKTDDRGIRRWFTLSSSPTDELLSITTRFAGKTSSSFKEALFSLKVGTELHMSDPMGDFVLPKLIQTPLIFVAGGIGITPFHSILKWLTDTGESRPIHLIHGVRNEDDILFLETFKEAGVRTSIVVSEASDAWGGERGQITAELISGLETITEDTLIYVSGPEPMVESLHKQLKKIGVPKNQLVGDFFPNYDSF